MGAQLQGAVDSALVAQFEGEEVEWVRAGLALRVKMSELAEELAGAVEVCSAPWR